KEELSAKSEDLKYAIANNLEPDYLFYLDQQVRKPLTEFLTLVGKGEETERVFAEVQDVLFQKVKARRMKLEQQNRQDFFTTGKKRKHSITKLKPPKKQTVTQKEKLEKLQKSTVPLTSFFTKKAGK